MIPKEVWIKKSDICSMLHIGERKWRQNVAEHNLRWADGLEEYFIAHSQNGYRMTRNTDLICASIADNRKRALDQLYKVSKVNQRLRTQGQYTLPIDENRIANLIELQGMTRAEFIERANELGCEIDKPTLSKMINNKVRATESQVQIFAQILDCGVFDIYPIESLGA